jgi:3-isopropylmalate/(R)-2-methylmalate dehydratase small subunit
MLIKGNVYQFGNDINTDVIYPGKYLSITTDREEMAKHCFEAVHPEFLKTAQRGDIIVAGRNFGCGSSREQAATCLKYFGIAAVIAESFARIFYRNAINLGLPVLIVPNIADFVKHGQTLEIDLVSGAVRNTTTGKTMTAQGMPAFVLEIITVGGLIPYLRKKLGIIEQEV